MSTSDFDADLQAAHEVVVGERDKLAKRLADIEQAWRDMQAQGADEAPIACGHCGEACEGAEEALAHITSCARNPLVARTTRYRAALEGIRDRATQLATPTPTEPLEVEFAIVANACRDALDDLPWGA